MRHRCGPHCGCKKCIVYPTKCNVVQNCSEEFVEHIHPSHTTVMNHHHIHNQHVFPHSTSVVNTVDSSNSFGGAFEVPAGPGVAAPAPGVMGPGVAPGVAPGMMGPGMGVAPGAPGMMGPGMGVAPGAPGMMGPGMGVAPGAPGMMGPGMGVAPGAPGMMGPGMAPTGVNPTLGR
jgi:spore coat protein D